MRLARPLIAALLVFGAGAASAKAPVPPAVLGRWHGKYVCGQGVTALNLAIEQAPKGGITATFRFGPLPENPSVPRGLYTMEGSFDRKSRRLKLKGVKWIDDSSGYLMVDLDGRMDAPGRRLSGVVPFPGCTRFELERDSDNIS